MLLFVHAEEATKEKAKATAYVVRFTAVGCRLVQFRMLTDRCGQMSLRADGM